jgi:hypothetical protein
MKRREQQQERILTDRELKATQGGTVSLSTSGDNGTGQQTDARPVIIETGEN